MRGLRIAVVGLAFTLLAGRLPFPLPTQAASAAPGCGIAHAASQDVTLSTTWQGLTRSTILHVPTGYNPATPVPLILNLQPATSDAPTTEFVSGMDINADKHGYLVAYPSATKGTDGSANWDSYRPSDPGYATSPVKAADDFGYLDAVEAQIVGQFCVDTSRIGATGYSAGGYMDYALACVGTAWLAAIIPDSSALSQDPATCTYQHPTPALVVEGQADPILWYGLAVPLLRSIPDEVGMYARAQGCQATGRQSQQFLDILVFDYGPCQQASTTVQLYAVTDGGHTWPGGWPVEFPEWWFGHTTYTIAVDELAYQFLVAHPLPGTATAARA